MTYLEHAQLSVNRYGGVVEDYIKIHKIMDSSKLYFASWQHRLFSHNLWFVNVLTELMDDTIINSDGKSVLVRDILIDHLKEDLDGFTPDLKDWLRQIRFTPIGKWVNNPQKHLLNQINNQDNGSDNESNKEAENNI